MRGCATTTYRDVARRVSTFTGSGRSHRLMALRAEALEADGVDVLVVPKVDDWMGVVGAGPRPTSFAQAISLALGPE